MTKTPNPWRAFWLGFVRPAPQLAITCSTVFLLLAVVSDSGRLWLTAVMMLVLGAAQALVSIAASLQRLLAGISYSQVVINTNLRNVDVKVPPDTRG